MIPIHGTEITTPAAPISTLTSTANRDGYNCGGPKFIWTITNITDPIANNGIEPGITLTRIKSGGGKGVKKATDITKLFEWSGEVCYRQDADHYCDGADPACTTRNLCCVDTDSSADGVFERCDLLDDVGILVDDVFSCPATDGVYPYTLEQAQCQTYVDNWIFNIADFVDYL